MSFQQAPHKLLLIPGPIEVSDPVLLANAHPSMSHVSPAFAPVFSSALKRLRKVLYTETAQPFIIAGSGTLGWDLVAANLIEAGEKALVLNSGYFGDSFADCLETYGAKVTQIGAPVGGRPSLEEVEAALKKDKYKVLTFTHVDTSTGVLSDAESIGKLVQRVSPETLVILDGVCSVASEEIRQDDWNIDVVVGASQKGLSAPPGLSITSVSKKALTVLDNRKTPVASYFASYKRWLPIMQSYEAGAPGYFATPPVNLIYALDESLRQITEGPVSLEQRFKLHKEASQKFKAAALELGFKQVAVNPEDGANGMTALYLPEGIAPPAIIGALGARDIVIAGGLHKDIKAKYIRFGHMGYSVAGEGRKDVDTLIAALQSAFAEVTASR
ncbi:PLP-dependent transferase [Leucosporidium creatinivorum]|uniref:alanine--glyoxylate transaminase n=1 Tax=Leucosporidium creatinivorum TaxID=106004 RepID=A0A1Y2EGW4_9BASI|nr:PLP-dependent transferase [Leucosporidium creatinivorum]